MPAPLHKLNLPGRLIRTFGRPLAEMGTSRLVGRLFAIEGADGSGRSTNIKALSEWLEAGGYAVKHMGLRRSSLLRAGHRKCEANRACSSARRWRCCTRRTFTIGPCMKSSRRCGYTIVNANRDFAKIQSELRSLCNARLATEAR